MKESQLRLFAWPNPEVSELKAIQLSKDGPSLFFLPPIMGLQWSEAVTTCWRSEGGVEQVDGRRRSLSWLAKLIHGKYYLNLCCPVW